MTCIMYGMQPDVEIVGQPVSKADRKFFKALEAMMISARKYAMSSIIMKTFCQKYFKSIVFINFLQNGDYFGWIWD